MLKILKGMYFDSSYDLKLLAGSDRNTQLAMISWMPWLSRIERLDKYIIIKTKYLSTLALTISFLHPTLVDVYSRLDMNRHLVGVLLHLTESLSSRVSFSPVFLKRERWKAKTVISEAALIERRLKYFRRWRTRAKRVWIWKKYVMIGRSCSFNFLYFSDHLQRYFFHYKNKAASGLIDLRDTLLVHEHLFLSLQILTTDSSRPSGYLPP